MKSFLTIIITCFLFSISFSEEKKPFFKLEDKKKVELIENSKSIKVGDSYKSVIKKMGKPKYDQNLVSKKNQKFIQRSLKYFVVIWEKDLVNEKRDQYITVYLNKNNKVTKVDLNIKK